MTTETRELLELAAKAAGIELRWPNPIDSDLSPRTWPGLETWNPLTDDGDALRLAVKLRIAIHHDDPDASQAGFTRYQKVPFTLDGYGPWFQKEWHRDSPDQSAATRRAIVRASAEIGRSMPCTSGLADVA